MSRLGPRPTGARQAQGRRAARFRVGPTAALAALLVAGSGAALARATVVAYETVEEQVRSANGVVLAVVEEVRGRETAADGVHTVVDLRVERWLAGSGLRRIELHEPGGRTARGSTFVAGAPRYEAGQRVVVMLHRLPDGAFRTRGLAAGRYEVLPALPPAPPEVIRDLRPVTTVRWTGGRMVLREPAVERYALDALVARIEAAAQRAGATAP